MWSERRRGSSPSSRSSGAKGTGREGQPPSSLQVEEVLRAQGDQRDPSSQGRSIREES